MFMSYRRVAGGRTFVGNTLVVFNTGGHAALRLTPGAGALSPCMTTSYARGARAAHLSRARPGAALLLLALLALLLAGPREGGAAGGLEVVAAGGGGKDGRRVLGAGQRAGQQQG